MISIKHLSKTFKNPDGSSITVLKDVNCDIQKGEVISIIGPSGTGKSTLLRAINMLEPPTSGEIWVDGENIMAKGYRLDKMRKKMGMVQAHALLVKYWFLSRMKLVFGMNSSSMAFTLVKYWNNRS